MGLFDTLKLRLASSTDDFAKILDSYSQSIEKDGIDLEFEYQILDKALKLADEDVINLCLSADALHHKSSLVVSYLESLPLVKRVEAMDRLHLDSVLDSLGPVDTYTTTAGTTALVSDETFKLLIDKGVINVSQVVHTKETVRTKNVESDFGYGMRDELVAIPVDPLRVVSSDVKRQALIDAGLDPNKKYPYLISHTIPSVKELDISPDRHFMYKSYNDYSSTTIHDAMLALDSEAMGDN